MIGEESGVVVVVVGVVVIVVVDITVGGGGGGGCGASVGGARGGSSHPRRSHRCWTMSSQSPRRWRSKPSDIFFGGRIISLLTSTYELHEYNMIWQKERALRAVKVCGCGCTWGGYHVLL